MSKGTNPGFAPGQRLHNPLLHRWVHIGKIPEVAALAWAKSILPDLEAESWHARSGIYLNRDDMLMLYRDEHGFRLFSWKLPL